MIRPTIALSFAIAAFAWQSAPAMAEQSGARVIEEVVVTARRREESLQDVPIAVQSFSAEFLEANGIREISDLSDITPGLQIRPGTFRDSTPDLFIRGFGAGATQIHSDPAIGLYFDEVPLSAVIGQNAAFFDLDNIQALKGPQGTLFGRNSTGGAVLVTTSRPVLGEVGGYARINSIGNHDSREVEGAVNIPLGETLAVRAAGSIVKRDGLWENVADGRDYDDKDSWAVRFSVLWEPHERFSNTTIYDYLEHDVHGSAIVFEAKGFDINDPSSYPSNGDVLPCPLDPSPFCAFHQLGIMLAPTPPPFNGVPATLDAEAAYQESLGWGKFDSLSIEENSRFGVAPYERIKNWGIANITTFQINDNLTLKNIFGYREQNMNHYENIDGTSFGLQLLAGPAGALAGLLDTQNVQWLEQITEEIQLQGVSFDGALNWVVGGFYSTYEGEDNSDFAQFGTRAFNIFTMDEAKSYSLFGEANWHFNDAFTLTLGVRHTWDDKSVILQNHLGLGPDGTPATGLFNPNIGFSGKYGKTKTLVFNGLPFPASNCNYNRTAVFGPGDGVNLADCSVPKSDKWNDWSYNINLAYQITDGTMVYGAHRRGYRSGFFSARATTDASLINNNEIVEDVELGLKSDFSLGEVAMRVNLAGYYAWYSDIATSISRIDPATGLPVNAAENSGKATLKGFEVAVDAAPTDDLRFNGNVSYTAGKYKEYPDQTVDSGLGTPLIFYENSGSAQFAYPRWTFLVGMTYNVPIVQPEQGELIYNVNYNYRSTKKDAGEVRKGFNQIDSYGLLNMALDWRNVMGSDFDIGVWVNNLTDEKYLDNLFGFEDAAGFRSLMVADTRTYGLRMSYSFGSEAR